MMCCPFPFLLFVVVVGCLYVACFFVCALFCLFFFIYFSLCFSFIKLVLFRSLARFSISLTYLNLHKCNSLLYINPRLYKHLLHLLIFNKAQCHFLVYFKIGGGQLETLCYFGHHTFYNLYCIYFYLGIICCNTLLSMLMLCK